MTPLRTVLVPPTTSHRGTVVWLHGLGASGHDFEPVVPMMKRPDLRWVFPHAPERPVTINGGYVMPAWYDILSMTRGPEREHRGHIEDATAQIEGLLADEEARLEAGGHRGDLVLLGFSQGAAMSLHVGLRHRQRLAGIGALSGYLVAEDEVESARAEENLPAPIFFGHGTRDGVVPVAMGRAAEATLRGLGHSTEWHDWRMGHEVCMEELTALSTWLGRVLPA